MSEVQTLHPTIDFALPRFTDECRNGAACIAANCWWAHPPDRPMPKLIAVVCKNGTACTNKWCLYLHPQRQIAEFVPKNLKGTCKFGKNCWDAACQKVRSHTAPPRMCGMGKKCPKKATTCQFSHEMRAADCKDQASCRLGDRCLFIHY